MSSPTCIQIDGSKISMSEFWEPDPLYTPVREFDELSYLGRTIRWLRDAYPKMMKSVLEILETTFIPTEYKVMGWIIAIGTGLKYDMRILLIYSGIMLTSYIINTLCAKIVDEHKAQIIEEENEQKLLNPKPNGWEDSNLKVHEEIKEGVQKIETILNANPHFGEIPVITPKIAIYSDWREESVECFSKYFLNNEPASSPIFVGKNREVDPYLFLRIKPKNTQDHSFWITLYPRVFQNSEDGQKVHWKIIVDEPGQEFAPFDNDLSLTERDNGELLHDNDPAFTFIEELVSDKQQYFEIDF